MERLNRNAPVLLLAVAALAAAAGTLALCWNFTFYADTWGLLMTRRELSVETLLHPHNEHLILLPALIEWVILQVFGMSSALPEYIVLIAMLVGTAVLVFVYVRRRIGPWPALYAAALILFLGPAWEVLLWPFEITFCGPMLFGIAMLLALEREDRRGDLAACLFLIASISFSSLGIAFIPAALVAIALGPRERWPRRAYVFVVPGLLFLAWYAGWGSDAESHLSLRNLFAAPREVADGIAATLASLVGLGTAPGGATDPLVWGTALTVALVIGLVLLKLRRPEFHRGLWPVAAAALTSWGLTALNLGAGRDPTASRYQYAGAIFILLLLANLIKGVRWNRTAIIGGAVVTVLAIGPNLGVLKDGRDYLKGQTLLTRSDTAAIEIAARTVRPDFQLNPEVAGTPTLVNVYAGTYLEAVDEHGSPAYSVEELASADEPGRSQADVVLAQALPLRLVTQEGEYDPRRGPGCERVGGDTGVDEVPLGPGPATIAVPPGGEAGLALRRFAEGDYPVNLGSPPGGSTSKLKIPADKAPQYPWQLQVDSARGVTVCPG